MKTIRITLVAAFVYSIIASGCGPNDDKGGMDSDNSKGEGAIDSTRLAKFDTSKPASSVPNFITTSIKSNTGEIKLLQLAQSKASSADIKKLAAMMIPHHTQMLNELNALAPAKQVSIDSSESDITRSAYQRLSSLSGKDFDEQWTQQLLQLHENSSELFTSTLSTTTDAELKQWLTKTLPIINQHRDMLAKLPMKQPNLQKGQTRD